MKRLPRFVVLTIILGLIGLPLPAAAAATPRGNPKDVPTAGLEFAKTATQITGIAISPLLGVGAVGAYKWFSAHTDQEKAALPWFANPVFWFPCLALVVACAFKDSFGTMIPPGLKKPFDALETAENKLTGLVTAGAVVPELVNSMSKALVTAAPSGAVGDPHLGGLAMIHLGAMDFSWLLDIAMVPLAVAIFAVVWLASHTINVLILLSPWGAVDAALKAARTSLLGLLTITAWIDPRAAAVLSLFIIIFAYLIAGWSFRLTVFGMSFCWDFFTRRRTRFQLEANDNKVFTAREVGGVPVRTYGRLHQEADGSLVLRFRPWLVLPPRELKIPREGLVAGRGVFYSEVLGPDLKSGGLKALLLLPPRYLGHEEAVVRLYRLDGTCDVGLRRAWAWLREALGFGPKKTQVAAAAA
jgi:hypothetical protein